MIEELFLCEQILWDVYSRISFSGSAGSRHVLTLLYSDEEEGWPNEWIDCERFFPEEQLYSVEGDVADEDNLRLRQHLVIFDPDGITEKPGTPSGCARYLPVSSYEYNDVKVNPSVVRMTKIGAEVTQVLVRLRQGTSDPHAAILTLVTSGSLLAFQRAIEFAFGSLGIIRIRQDSVKWSAVVDSPPLFSLSDLQLLTSPKAKVKELNQLARGGIFDVVATPCAEADTRETYARRQLGNMVSIRECESPLCGVQAISHNNGTAMGVLPSQSLANMICDTFAERAPEWISVLLTLSGFEPLSSFAVASLPIDEFESAIGYLILRMTSDAGRPEEQVERKYALMREFEKTSLFRRLRRL